MNHVIKVVVTAYDSLPWLKWCLDSLACQTYPSSVCVVDDASPDDDQRSVISQYCERHGWVNVMNAENRGSLYSREAGIDALDCSGDDIIVSVDGDDWLSRNDALEIVGRAYDEPGTLLTYGSYMTYPDGERGVCRATPRRVIRKAGYRKHTWIYSHLKTFRFVLWDAIAGKDFLHDDGEYYREATDMAFMYPMLEMANGRFRFIKDVLYVYNKASEIHVDRLRRDKQVETEMKIRNKKPYEPLRLSPL